MNQNNYRTKITTHRQFYPIDDLDYSIESDRGRILSSPAFRRLQSLRWSLNASIRTRADGLGLSPKTIILLRSKEQGAQAI